MRKNWDAVLFDFDGTLVDSAPDIIAALNRLLDEIGHDAVHYDTYRTRAGDGARKLLTETLIDQGTCFKEAELPVLVDRLLDHYYGLMTEKTRLYQGVPEVLEEIYNSGMALAVCTNRTSKTTKYLLSHFGLTKL